MLLFNIQFLFNHASHTQHNSCTYVQVVDLQMERDSNIYILIVQSLSPRLSAQTAFKAVKRRCPLHFGSKPIPQLCSTIPKTSF